MNVKLRPWAIDIDREEFSADYKVLQHHSSNIFCVPVAACGSKMPVCASTVFGCKHFVFAAVFFRDWLYTTVPWCFLSMLSPVKAL